MHRFGCQVRWQYLKTYFLPVIQVKVLVLSVLYQLLRMKRIAMFCFFPLNFIVFESTNHIVLDKNTKVANKGKIQRRKKQKSKCEDSPTSVEGSI